MLTHFLGVILAKLYILGPKIHIYFEFSMSSLLPVLSIISSLIDIISSPITVSFISLSGYFNSLSSFLSLSPFSLFYWGLLLCSADVFLSGSMPTSALIIADIFALFIFLTVLFLFLFWIYSPYKLNSCFFAWFIISWLMGIASSF